MYVVGPAVLCGPPPEQNASDNPRFTDINNLANSVLERSKVLNLILP